MSNNINVTEGSGKTVATEDVGGSQFQKVEIYGGGGASILGINPDRSISVSVIGGITIQSGNASIIAVIKGSVATVATGNQSISGAVNVSGSVLLGSSNASVIAIVPGSISAVITGGSIAAVAAGNQSISGAITVAGSVLLGSSNASVIAVVQGSIAAAQIGTQITSISGGVITSISGGISSVALVGANTVSVVGTVGASIIGLVPVQTSNTSVISYIQNSVATVIIGGSVSATFTPPANQSVSGTVQADIRGSVAAVIIGGSIATVVSGNQSVSGMVNVGSVVNAFPATISAVNSTTTPVTSTLSFTGTSEEWKDFGTITVNVFTDAVSATDGLSIQQSSNGTNWDITDTYTIPSMSGGQGKTYGLQPAARFGRIVYTQGAQNSGAFRLQTVLHPQYTKPSSQRPGDGYTNETDLEQSQAFHMVYDDTSNTWYRQRGTSSLGTLVNLGASSVVTRTVITSIATAGAVMGSVATLQGTNPWNVAGSVAAFQAGTQITSLVSTVPSSVIVGASIFGQLPAGTAMIGSVAAYQGTVPWAISGSVATTQTGTVVTSLVSTVPSSVIVGASIFGQLPAGTAVLGSVAALQGTNPWIVTSSVTGGLFPISGSVAATITNTNLNVSGSVVAFQGTSPFVVNFQNSSILAVPVGSTVAYLQAPSIVGSYAEDAAHTTADKGLFVLTVRNDLLSSVTSADGDYSQFSTGPVGEGIVANAPLTKWVQGTADFRQGNTGASIIAIASGGSSVFTYITAVQVANMGPSSVLVTLASGGSTLGYTIAPAGGGSNIYYPNGLKTPGNFGFAASLNGIASVLVSAQGFVAKV